MVHRALLGSLERFFGVLTEHYAGAFPVWLAPVQARILPVSEKFNDYAAEVAGQLKEKDIRVEIDDCDEKLGKKIRNAEISKIPYMLVVGEKEEQDKSLAVRSYETKKQETLTISDFIKKLQRESEVG